MVGKLNKKNLFQSIRKEYSNLTLFHSRVSAGPLQIQPEILLPLKLASDGGQTSVMNSKFKCES